MLVALTRAVPPSIVNCELTHLERTPIDYARAVEQHDEYERTLEQLGCRVERVAAAPDLPDSVFIEDTAVALDTVAIVARPGAPSRRPETPPVAEALKRYRDVVFMQAAATLDGGDVLRVGSRLYVGVSTRTNDDGVRQLRAAAARDGLGVVAIPIARCLHLKSAVTALRHDPPLALINRGWIDPGVLDGCETVDIDPAEPGAANVLLVRDTVVCAAEFPRTREALEKRGLRTVAVPAGELAKAEGALTCGSIVFEERL
jgi:dimethylargininase